MKDHSNELEPKLRDQQAAELDEALLDRLEAAAQGDLTELTAAELAFEAKLRAVRPQGLPSSLLERLESKVEGLPAPNQVHVLPFPGKRATQSRKQPEQRRWLATAAAVALLGALSAMFFDPSPSPSATAQQPPAPAQNFSPAPLVPSDSTLPAEFSRAISETRDQGFIWPTNEQPHRVLKVIYTERVSMKREDGSTYEVEQPRVEYYLVPTESH